MKQIDAQTAGLLYDKLLEAILNQRITPKERIPKYRTILDELFKNLTSDSGIFFSDLFSRTSFIFESEKTPREFRNKINELRTFSNKVVHEPDCMPGSDDDERCALLLSEVIQFFSDSPPGEKIRKYTEKAPLRTSEEPVRQRPTAERFSFFAVIEGILIPQGNNSQKFCVLTLNTEELGNIKLKLWNNKNAEGFGSDLTPFGKLAEKYQRIFITEVRKFPNAEDEYFATEYSLIVLEPDYLIDAKELSECRQLDPQSNTKYNDNPLIYIFNKFSKGTVTDKMLAGVIVGRMLDDMVISSDYQYGKSFEAVMRENAFGMMCIAGESGSYDRNKIQKIYEKAGTHETALKSAISKYKGQELLLEPTFISNKYGLQGRLDLLVKYPDKPNQMDIIELKSSEKVPARNFVLYQNHEAQTICYNLLIESTYPDRTGTASILYSNAAQSEEPLRNVTTKKHISVQELLMLRNRIVAFELKLAAGQHKPFTDILKGDSGKFPPYMSSSVNEFRATMTGLPDILKHYFLGYLKFIYRELVIAKIGSNDPYAKSNGYADLWKASKTEKIENYDVLIYLKIKDVTDDFRVELTFENDLFTGGITVSSFRVGDTAILYPTPNPDELNPLKSQILKCRVEAAAENSITVALISRQVDKTYFSSSHYWALDRDFWESGFKQSLNLLYEFVRSDERTINLVLGLQKPSFSGTGNILADGLDPVQFEQVKNAVRAEDYYLIQGPPGTGKTSKVLVEIVKNISRDDTNIMIMAYTNRAVDEICEKLNPLNIDLIRLGKGSQPYNFSKLSESLKLGDLYDKVRSTKVFVTTISTFYSSMDLLNLKSFDTLIIDEASQVLETQIAGFLKRFKKWIFIGDENQLPAVVTQSEEESLNEKQVLKDICLDTFRESLFYRLKKNAVKNGWNDCYGLLEYQYRMHNDIADFPNRMFYKGLLKSTSPRQNEPIPQFSAQSENGIHHLFTSSRVVFVPTKPDYRTKINDEEAKVTVALIKHIAELFGDNFDPFQTVGVITPFRAQIANVRNHLGSKFRDVTIDTVERYQGSERDIIIASFAVKSPAQLRSIQSLTDNGVDRKLNVALTRAKEQLFLLGNEEVLSANQLFKSLIQHIRDKGGYSKNPLISNTKTPDYF